MKISKKLISFFVGALAVFFAWCFILLAQLWQVSRSYDALLDSEVREMAAARTVQVHFEKQVQEWKDLLLRGHTPEDLKTYTARFEDEESQVLSSAQALADRVEDPEARGLLEQFLVADHVLSAKYQTAYDAYVAGRGDFKSADRIERGRDRAPADLLDAVVIRLNNRLALSVAEQRQKVRANLTVAICASGGLLLLLSTFGFLTLRHISLRLSRLKDVSDHLMRADMEGLLIDLSGEDEIGEFGESMKSIHAVIQELQHEPPTLVKS